MNPTTIGNYRIIRTLGEGGMGTVYEAEQDQPHRMVALKVIRPAFVSPDLIRRFARESEALGRLQHPGIAQIYEAGTAEGPHGPQSYFAMELIRGHPLNEYLARQSVGLNERLALFARICDAVHYAHQQGVIHRDLKPANILVDEDGQPKILDFGVARLTDADVQATRQTSVGEVVGTLQYMSPEQVNADPTEIDRRSDVYSLGVVLYELLAGRPPYDLSRKMIYEAARVILVDDPAPLRSHDRRLAQDVEIIVAKTLAKEREQRYASAEELASDIRRFLRDEPIMARPASAIYHLRKFARRNRALVGGLLVAAGILVIGTAVSVWQAVRATSAERLAESRRNEAVRSGALAERRRAVADSALLVADSARATAQRERAAAVASAQQARAEAAKAQAINGFLQNMLASSDPSIAQGKELSLRELLDKAATTKAPELAGQPEVMASVQATIGRTYYALGLYDQARPHLDTAYAIRRRQSRAGLPTGQSADELGKLAKASGDYPLAEQRLREALAILRTRLPANDDQVTSTLMALADVRYSRGSFPEAEGLYREALRLTRSRHGREGAEVADRLQGLGLFFAYTNRPGDGEPLLTEALATLRRTFGESHPQVIDALIGLSDAQIVIPNYQAAEATLREALPVARKVFGAEHPMIANVADRLGDVLRVQGRPGDAEPFAREALTMRVKLLGPQHPDVQLARAALGHVAQMQGRYAEADTLFTEALTARRAVLGGDSPAVAASLDDLGDLAASREDWVGSAARFSEARAIWQTAKVEERELNAASRMAWAEQQMERTDQALATLEQVLTRRRTLNGEKHWAVGDIYEKIAAIAFRKGQLARAESLSVLGLEIRRAVYGRSPAVGYQLQNVAFMREALGDTTGAVPMLREALDLVATAGPSAPTTLVSQLRLGVDLCATGQVAEGDSLIRLARAHAPTDSTHPLPYRLRAGLGSCLTRAGRFPEAETLLLEAEAGLRALPVATGDGYRRTVVDWLVSLYRQSGRPADAEAWKAKRVR